MRDALRAQIGYVEQDAPVLAGSLRDNLTLGTPDATMSAKPDSSVFGEFQVATIGFDDRGAPRA